jgi:signal transduction histidine kinase
MLISGVAIVQQSGTLRSRTALWPSLFVGLCLSSVAGANPLPRSVLILDQLDQSSPFYAEFVGAFQSVLNAEPEKISLYRESLDFGRFKSPEYEDALHTYLKVKYSQVALGAIVVIGSGAVDFALNERAKLWPNVPVVLSALDLATADHVRGVPNVTGAIMRTTLNDSVNAARILVPQVKQIALVGDRFEDQPPRRHFREEMLALAGEIEFVDLTGLPMKEVLSRVSALPDDSVIVYTGVYRDEEGKSLDTSDRLALVAPVSNRPIVVDRENNFGFGAIGGFLSSAVPAGKNAARLAIRVLSGEDASRIPIIVGDSTKLAFDWRVLKRWNISERGLPPEAEIRFREHSVWDEYRWPICAALAIVLLQALMISGLLIERRRRRYAEAESQARRREVAHLNRAAATTVLSTSIAHELNQPLTAILSNVQAGEYLLKAEAPDLQEIGQILADIRHDDNRASEIIRRLRNLLANKKENLQTFDLNDAVREVAGIVSPEAQKRRVALKVDQARSALPVRADWVHLQQVMLNLLMNAMDALENCDVRKLTILTARKDENNAEVLVADSGKGISEGDLRRVFEPFFTTKSSGTGLGLPIARAILETYNGTIRAESQSGGTVFRVTLPLQRSA